MTETQRLLVIAYGIISLLIFLVGSYKTKKRKQAFELVPLGIFGIFVWGDAVIIGLFWFLASIVTLVINNWLVTLLIVSLFWVVRSFGEIVYWLLEQFATKKRDMPDTVPWHTFFHGESVWFAQQVWWQMMLVASLLATILIVKEL